MPLEFNCPNGHRIVCPDDRAGSDGRCPKCGVTFRVPSVSGATAAPVAAVGAGGAATAPLAGARVEAAGEGGIVFLCPNGHRLSGPARLQGQAGQCPHCGARFLVPVLSEFNDSEELGLADISDDDVAPQGVARQAQPVAAVHPLCDLVRKLWDEKQHGGVVELHLDNGAMLVPDWFDARLSRQSHGLFANQAADGTVTITAVAWDSVSRVVVRNVEGLPHGTFGD